MNKGTAVARWAAVIVIIVVTTRLFFEEVKISKMTAAIMQMKLYAQG